jgi:hypothetical protein
MIRDVAGGPGRNDRCHAYDRFAACQRDRPETLLCRACEVAPGARKTGAFHRNPVDDDGKGQFTTLEIN